MTRQQNHVSGRPVITSDQIPDPPVQVAVETTRLQGRVLLAEDNRFNQKVACSMLHKLGLEVEIVANGRDAVAEWARSGYDVILMDCQMPDMDGFAATRLIRAQERGNGYIIPIIALTANALQDDRQRCLEAGMNDYLAKPFNRKDLVATLLRWLKARKPASLVAIPKLPKRRQRHKQLPPTIDRQILERLREAMGEDFLELPPAYLGETNAMLEALGKVHERTDASEIKRLAHNIKSSSAALGALYLSQLAKELEVWAEHGKIGEMNDRVAVLRNEFARVETKLNELGVIPRAANPAPILETKAAAAKLHRGS